MDDPNVLPAFRTIFGGAIVGLALLIVPLLVYLRYQDLPQLTTLRRQLLLGISAIGMIVLAAVLITVMLPDFWNSTERFDTKAKSSQIR